MLFGLILMNLLFPITWGLKQGWRPAQFVEPLFSWLFGYGLILALIELMAIEFGHMIIDVLFFLPN